MKIGLFEAILIVSTLLEFNPLIQAIKIIRLKKAEDVSVGTFIMILAIGALWLIYGFKIGSLPLKVGNCIKLFSSLAVIIVYLMYKKGGENGRRGANFKKIWKKNPSTCLWIFLKNFNGVEALPPYLVLALCEKMETFYCTDLARYLPREVIKKLWEGGGKPIIYLANVGQEIATLLKRKVRICHQEYWGSGRPPGYTEYGPYNL